MSFEPAPATTLARSPTAARTTFSSSSFSCSSVVGDSPVVPLTTNPLFPRSTRSFANFAAASKSIFVPSDVNGVTIAVRTVPNAVSAFIVSPIHFRH